MVQLWPIPGAIGEPESQSWDNIESAAESLRTNHAGPAEPPNTVAFMFWMQSTTGILWQRNSANTGWNEVLTVGAGGAELNAAGGYRQTIDGWAIDNVSASMTAVALSRLSVGAAFPAVWIAPRPGSITAVSVKSNSPRTAGTLTVEVYKNGVATGLVAVLDGTNTVFHAATQAKDTDTFVAGDELDVRVTTDAGWLPSGTPDIRSSIEVET